MGKVLETGTVTDHINLHKLTKQCNKYKNGDMLTCIGTIMYHTIMTVNRVLANKTQCDGNVDDDMLTK